MSLDAIPSEMGWGEALGHLRIVRADPSSMFAAAIEGWSHPVSREALILMDLYDLDRASAGDKKWKGYPRPFKVKGAAKAERIGNTSGRTDAEVTEYLRALGHNLPPV